MAKNNKPKLDESEYFDDIQSQITELMGPPPLRTTPLDKNIQKDSSQASDNSEAAMVPVTNNSTKQKEEPNNNQKKPVEAEKIETKRSTESTPKESAKNNSQEAGVELEDIDKTKTIEQAEKDAAKASKEPAVIEQAGEKTDSIYSAKVQSAVKDIEAHENDLYDEADSEGAIHLEAPAKKKKKSYSLKNHKKLIIAFFLIFILGLFVTPASRYFILNTAGVRGSVNLSVVDQKSLQPVKNAEVIISGIRANTNDQGKAELKGVKLGTTTINIKKRSFAPLEQPITIGLGSNPINDPFQMDPAGTSYSFVLKDYISGQPLEGIKISSQDSSTLSNKDGLVEIKIEAAKDDETVITESEMYRSEKLSLPLNNKEQFTVNLVPAQPNVFVSNRDGKYNLYKRDVDGKNETVIFAATGKEVPESMSILTKPKSTLAGFVSTRDGQRNDDGYFLSNLYIVDAAKKIATKVDGTLSEQIRLIGWSDNKLIFVKTIAGPSGRTEGRQRIIAYDNSENKWRELAKADSFTDVIVKGDTVYYGVSGSGGKLYKISVDGSAKKVLLDKEVWSIRLNNQKGLVISGADRKTSFLTFADGKLSAIDTPAITNSFMVLSPSDKHFAYIERRDGRNVLVVTEEGSSKEKIYKLPNGSLSYPISWINDKYFIVRTNDSRDSASFVVNIDSTQINRIGNDYQIGGPGGIY